MQAMGFKMQTVQSSNMRRHMVDSQLRTSGVSQPWIIQAMLELQRESFVPAERAAIAYRDRPVDIGAGRMLNPPLAAGLMLSAAEPEPSDHVLLIGAGTGYLAALLVGRVRSLVAVEEQPELLVSAKQSVAGVEWVEAPLNVGAADKGPYDLIIIDGAVEILPDTIKAQLKEGGRIVTGLCDGPARRLASAIRHGDHVALRTIADTEIAPLPGFARVREFSF